MLSRCTFGAVLGFLLVGVCGSGSAQTLSIPVTNASFEEPETSTFTTTIPGWSGVSESGVHSFAFVANQYLDAAAPDGAQFGYINSGSIFQDVPEIITTGQTYTMTGFIGRRNDATNPLGSASLFTMNGAVLATTGFLSPPSGRFTEFSVSFTAEAGSPHLGQGLRIALSNFTSNQQINFDKIALTKTAVVPAPASIMTALVGLLPCGVLFWRRRGQ